MLRGQYRGEQHSVEHIYLAWNVRHSSTAYRIKNRQGVVHQTLVRIPVVARELPIQPGSIGHVRPEQDWREVGVKHGVSACRLERTELESILKPDGEALSSVVTNVRPPVDKAVHCVTCADDERVPGSQPGGCRLEPLIHFGDGRLL